MKASTRTAPQVSKVTGVSHTFLVINYGNVTDSAGTSNYRQGSIDSHQLQHRMTPGVDRRSNVSLDHVDHHHPAASTISRPPVEFRACSSSDIWASTEDISHHIHLRAVPAPRVLAADLQLNQISEAEEFEPIVRRDDELVYRNVQRTTKSRLTQIARRCRLFTRRRLMRLIYKNGECNISNMNVEKQHFRMLLDIVTTFIELKWKYVIFIYTIAYLVSWMTFAVIWWLIHAYNSSFTGAECVVGVTDLKTAILFSIETQQTVGYGGRMITESCVGAMFALMAQLLVGAVMQSIVTGLIFAKLSRPNRRAQTVIFSKKAVIFEQDGGLCLAFRIGDMRRSQLIGVDVNVILVESKDGGLLTHHLLDTTTESDNSFFFLAWPINVIHRIDEASPLWNLAPEQLLVADFEIIVVLEASCETTGFTTQVRTSYLPSEILWGHELAPLPLQYEADGNYTIDYAHFNKVAQVDTPETSALELQRNMIRERNRYFSTVEIIKEI